MMGGEGFKYCRRYILPFFIALHCFFTHNYVGLLSIPLLIGAFHIGYGVYDPTDDKPSFLSKICLNNMYIIRTVVSIIYSVAMIPIFWGRWNILILQSLTILITTLLAITFLKRWAKLEQFVIGISLPIFV
jgi:hypothetical protein